MKKYTNFKTLISKSYDEVVQWLYKNTIFVTHQFSLQSNQIVNNTCLCLYCIVAVKRCCDCSELTRPCESILWNVSLLTREELPKEVTIHCFGSTLISAESNLTQKWRQLGVNSIRVKVTRFPSYFDSNWVDSQLMTTPFRVKVTPKSESKWLGWSWLPAAAFRSQIWLRRNKSDMTWSIMS